MKQKLYRFNLIEIVLAVAVVGFGVVVILGMLPKGLRATQNAGIEAYSSQIIDQMGNYLQLEGGGDIAKLVTSTSAEQNVVNGFVSGGTTDKYIMGHYMELLAFTNYADSFSSTKVQRTNMRGVYKLLPTGTGADESLNDMGDVYIVVMGTRNVIDGEVENRIDFSGILRVWKRPRKYQQVKIQHNASGDHDCDSLECGKYDSSSNPEPYSFSSAVAASGATICMELAYPLSLPHAERTKRYYCFDVDR